MSLGSGNHPRPFLLRGEKPLYSLARTLTHGIRRILSSFMPYLFSLESIPHAFWEMNIFGQINPKCRTITLTKLVVKHAKKSQKRD